MVSHSLRAGDSLGGRLRKHHRSTFMAIGVVALMLLWFYSTAVRADRPDLASVDGQGDGAVAVGDPDLDGVWTIASGVHNGRPIPVEELEGMRTIVRANAISSYDAAGRVQYRCIYTFDAHRAPHTIDMVSSMPKDQDAEAPGIYKVDGDVWTLCYARGGSERPTEFESPEGSGIMLLEMKRSEPQGASPRAR